MSDSKKVYSTETGSHKNDKEAKKAPKSTGGPLKMRLETAGRGGKAVTVLFNLPFGDTEAKAMMKEMQTKFGCGATFKDGAIELRGDLRPRIEEFLAGKQMKVVRAGG